MADKQDGKTLADPELDEWLRVDSLELKPLFDLARGVDPDLGDWPPPYPWKPRWRALKNAITTGNLKATYFFPIPEKHTIVFLADLWAFVRGPGDEWQWARDFCQRWAAVRGDVLPQSKPSKKRQAGGPKDSTLAGWKKDYEGVVEGRKVLGPGTTINDAAKWAAEVSDKEWEAIKRGHSRYKNYQRKAGQKGKTE